MLPFPFPLEEGSWGSLELGLKHHLPPLEAYYGQDVGHRPLN